MKTIKPLKLGVIHRSFEHGGKCYFVPSLLLFFPFETPDVPLHEVAMWKMVTEELGEEVALDEGMWKEHGELLVTGCAYPPGGRPQKACAVRVACGSIDKQLYVVGDRVWKDGVPSEPEPFTEMRLGWARAFGGEGYERNPLGKGYRPLVDEATGERVQPLPNIEVPGKLLTSPRERPEPAGLGPIDNTWPQRFAKRGTYDKKWLEERFPGLADDIDWTFFNTAPPDQWVEGVFTGGETFVLENLHPTEPKIESRLPALRGRCFVTRAIAPEAELREVPLRLDTVQLFPHRKRGIAFFRGVLEVEEDDASDLALMLAALERIEEPKPLSHYQGVLAARLDKNKGYLHALRDRDLLPPRTEGAAASPEEAFGEMEELLTRDGLIEQNTRRGAERKLADLRARLVEEGVDPDEHGVPEQLPEPDPVPDLEELPEFVEQQVEAAERARAEAEAEREKTLAKAREMCAEHGKDLDEVMAQSAQGVGGPPKFSAEREMQLLRDQAELGRNAGVPLLAAEQKLADPAYLASLEETERQLKTAYRKFAQYFPAARRLEGEEASRLREDVVAARERAESLAGRDLTGADLSELDLSNVDLSGAFLEAADLHGADLTGADLTGAVLARADLTGAKLTGAKLVGTSFGAATLHGTDLSGPVDMTGAVLSKADVEGADFTGARLDGVDLLDARLANVRFSGMHAKGLIFMRTDLTRMAGSHCSFAGCVLEQCNFLDVDLEEVDFSGARLSNTAFVNVRADRCRFDEADCAALRVVAGSSMVGASFRRAKLGQANLRATDLREADFGEAFLEGADLSESRLEGACFERAQAAGLSLMKTDLRRARLRKANLMGAQLQKADIAGADLRETNLFRADMARTKGDSETQLDGALTKFARVVKRARIQEAE